MDVRKASISAHKSKGQIGTDERAGRRYLRHRDGIYKCPWDTMLPSRNGRQSLRLEHGP